MKSKKGISKASVSLVGKKKIAKFWKKTMKSKEAREGYLEAEALYNFVEKLNLKMKKKHLSYYAVAKNAGIDHQSLARILNGAKNAEVSTLSKVAYGVGSKLNLGLVKR